MNSEIEKLINDIQTRIKMMNMFCNIKQPEEFKAGRISGFESVLARLKIILKEDKS